MLAINLDKLPSPCDYNSSPDSFGSLLTVPGLLSKTLPSVPIAIGEVPCGQGVLLSSGRLGVLADISVDSFNALCFDRGWREGTRTLGAVVSGVMSCLDPAAFALATALVGSGMLLGGREPWSPINDTLE